MISELGESSATVRTLIDVDTSIGALVGADGSAAMLMGDYIRSCVRAQVKVTWLTEGAQLFGGRCADLRLRRTYSAGHSHSSVASIRERGRRPD